MKREREREGRGADRIQKEESNTAGEEREYLNVLLQRLINAQSDGSVRPSVFHAVRRANRRQPPEC